MTPKQVFNRIQDMDDRTEIIKILRQSRTDTDIQAAITHARQIAEQGGCPAGSGDCAYQHDHLADWLEELLQYRAYALDSEMLQRGRLTERVGDYIRIKGCSTLYSSTECPRAYMNNAIIRLVKFEDNIGGHEIAESRNLASMGKALAEVDEFDEVPIKRLQELTLADKENRVQILPRMIPKVGDTVWTPIAMAGWYMRKKDRPYDAKVVFIGLNGDNDGPTGGGILNIAYDNGDHMMEFTFADIGKHVFLTREEAEASMAKEGKQ